MINRPSRYVGTGSAPGRVLPPRGDVRDALRRRPFLQVHPSTITPQSTKDARQTISQQPSNAATAATNTSARTLPCPAAALLMTAPPYEWPTSTTGPSIDPTTADTNAA